jgi:hypothetical protein
LTGCNFTAVFTVAYPARTVIRSPEWNIHAAPADQGQGGSGTPQNLSLNSSRKIERRQLGCESNDRRDIGSAES